MLQFALRLTEGEEVIQISEDNGEIACGELLGGECLSKYVGTIFFCVSRKVQGFYVSDMIQGIKLRVVKEAAVRALESIFKHFNAGCKRREKMRELAVPQIKKNQRRGDN